MILSIVIFSVTFVVVFGLALVISHKSTAAFEAQRELNARIAHQRLLAEIKSDDMWRGNKRLVMR